MTDMQSIFDMLFALAILLFIALFIVIQYVNRKRTKNMSPEEKEAYFKDVRARAKTGYSAGPIARNDPSNPYSCMYRD